MTLAYVQLGGGISFSSMAKSSRKQVVEKQHGEV